MIRLLLLLLVAVPLMGRDVPELIPRKVLFGGHGIEVPLLSPDGSKVLFLDPRGKMIQRNLVLGAPSSSLELCPSACWHADSQRYFKFVDGDGNEEYHLIFRDGWWKIFFDDDLTPYPGVTARGLRYHPNVPNQVLVGMNQRLKSEFDIYRIDLDAETTTLDTQNPGGSIAWLADDQLQVKAMIQASPEGYALLGRLSADEEWRVLLRWSSDEGGDLIDFSPTGKTLYLRTNWESNTIRVVGVDMVTGQVEVLAEHPEYDLGGVFICDGKIRAVECWGERLEWIVIDSSFESEWAFLLQHLGPHFLFGNSDLEERRWVVASFSDVQPMIYWIYDRTDKTLERVVTANTDWERYDFRRREPVWFVARDGEPIPAYLTLPSKLNQAHGRAVIMVHGGPWSRDLGDFCHVSQWLASRGYAVLSVNFRGSSGYGKRFLSLGHREWGGKMLTDLIDGKNWLVSQGYAESDSVGIVGASYGGYAVLSALTLAPDEFSCGCSEMGVSNLFSFLEMLPPHWDPEYWYRRVGHPKQDADLLRERSPCNFADQVTAPLMLEHGVNDPRCHQGESNQMAAALRAKGRSCLYLVYPNEGHGLYDASNRLPHYAAAEAFLGEHLGGHVEPPAPDETWDQFVVD